MLNHDKLFKTLKNTYSYNKKEKYEHYLVFYYKIGIVNIFMNMK